MIRITDASNTRNEVIAPFSCSKKQDVDLVISLQKAGCDKKKINEMVYKTRLFRGEF